MKTTKRSTVWAIERQTSDGETEDMTQTYDTRREAEMAARGPCADRIRVRRIPVVSYPWVRPE